MNKGLWILVVLGIIGAIIFFNAKGTYNSLVTSQEGVEAQWAEVENNYQRRADLIPNLVETVKGYKDFEQETLTGVAEARAKVGQLTVDKEVLENPELMARFSEAQGELGSVLSRLLSVAENYPDLKANEGFRDLRVQLEGTENRITVARNRFNETARAHNTQVKTFPNNIYANFFGFDEVSYFQSAQGSEQAPKVEF
ncbi:MAG: LemA family protein [Bacteroidota bacterium]